MKKITLVMALLVLWSFNSYAQYVDEDFESGTFPPAGWLDIAGPGHVDNGAADNTWASSTFRSNSPTRSAFFNDFTVDNDRWLISPAFDLSSASNPELVYFENTRFIPFVANQEVLWSDDYDGSGDPSLFTWTVLNSAPLPPDEDVWVQKGPFTIPSADATVYIAFNYVGNNKSEWFIDDIEVRDELLCTPAVGTVTLVEDCPNLEFSIDVLVTDLGDSTTVTIANTGGEPDETVSSVPTTVTIGPFPSGTPVGVLLLHDTTVGCDVILGNTVDACVLPNPANDDFANAEPIDCTSSLTGTTSNAFLIATLDEATAEPGFGVDMDSPNVWYSYDSSVEGANAVTVSLCGSSFDTKLGVYTGTTGNLSIVQGNDDSNSCGVFSLQSELTFTANGTDTYYIAVLGFDFSEVGDFTLSVSCGASCSPAQANQDCNNTLPLLVDGSTATIDNTCATINAESPSCDMFQSISDVWYTFEAPASGQVNIISALGSASAVRMAVYSGACGALVEEDCASDIFIDANSLSLTGLSGTYFLQLWNNSTADEGTFDITLSDASLSAGSFENEKAFTYFPNPVKNELSLKAQNNIQNISVYNMLGQEVLRTTPNSLESNLNMNSLSQGAYFVQVTINNVTETVRIIKQ